MDYATIPQDYLNELNPQQRAAVEYCDGPELVIAGAGSGKTRVLTYKIVHLLAGGYEPWRIMALTFTNKAAREMKERIAGVVGEEVASRLWMGTFHSVFLKILRRHADLIGYKSNFTIYDATDQRSLLKSIIRDLELDEKVYKPATIAAVISNAKNALVDAKMYAEDKDYLEADRRANRPYTAEIYRIYAERCRLAGAMDFDDILLNMSTLLYDRPDVALHYQDLFRYILVDEYQDTNFAQHLIVTKLAERHKRLCVVGDDAQSIYSFRGASITNILTLDKRWPDLKVFKLERNYRSTQNIVNAASSLIAKNRNQIAKHVYSEKQAGEPVEIVAAYSDFEEGYLIASMVANSKLSHHDSYDDYAVLYRTNAQSRVLEEALRKRNMPYRIYGGLSFYQRKEVKDAICYFRLAINPDDDEALRRVINYPARGIGETTVKKLQSAAIAGGVSIWQVICNPEKFSLNVNSGTLKKLNGFAEIIKEGIKDVDGGLDAYVLGQKIYARTSLMSVLETDSTPESVSRKENLQELLKGIHDFVTMSQERGDEDVSMQAFLSVVSLATDQDQDEETNEPKITLMTAHSAKGLEFKHIFVVGVEEDLFPSAMATGSPAEIEEERRLLYVAVTRAKESCTLTYARTRFRNGQTMPTNPSRFIMDFDPRFLVVSGASIKREKAESPFINPIERYRSREQSPSRPFAKGKSYSPGKPASPSPAVSSGRKLTKIKPASPAAASPTVGTGKLAPGVKVVHEKFGAGVVAELSEMSGNPLAIVDFETFGRRKLLLKFATLTVID